MLSDKKTKINSIVITVIFLLFFLITSHVQAVFSIDSTVKVDDSTTNGPTLSDNDNFGVSVAVIGDLNDDGVEDLVVGANRDDAGSTDRGAVHILFMNTDGSVDSTVEINDNTTNGPVLANSDFFGNSVAAIGDLNDDGVEDLVVGANGDNTGGTDRGAVHILFMNTDGSVDSTVKVDDSTTNGPVLTDSDFFGYSVAVIGDLNDDGVKDIVSGGYGDDTGGTGRGAVHILFMNTDGSVDSTVEINDNTTNGPVLADSDSFGVSVASIEDLNGDSVEDLVVGAFFDDTSGSNKGAVHIMFMNTDGSVDSTVKVDDSTTNGPSLTAEDFFGGSVTSFDVDGDSVEDILVGATGDDTNGTRRGAVHIMYLNTDGSVDSSAKVDDTTTNGPVLTDSNFYGYSISNIGDLNGDTTTDLVVGAYGDDTNGTNRGSIHVSFMGGGADVSSPTISTLSPLDNAISVGVESNLVITFNEIVTTQTGNITIYKASDNSVIESISVESGQVTGSGTATITVNPSVTLDSLTQYYIQIDSTAFDDASGNSFAGISNTTSWSFETEDVDVPAIVSFSPQNGATDISIDTNLIMVFDQSVDIEVGNITIYEASDNLIFESINVLDGNLSGGGTNTITIDPQQSFEKGKQYYIQIDSTAFDDASGNSFAGISNTTSWSFETEQQTTSRVYGSYIYGGNYRNIQKKAFFQCSMYGSITLVKRGAISLNAKNVQRAVNQVLSNNLLVEDGIIGIKSFEGIKKAQLVLKTTPDGIWGPITQKLYLEWLIEKCKK